jgi:hypothetical protein
MPLTAHSRHIGDWAHPVKKWAEGEDFSPVKALYLHPAFSVKVNYTEPVMPVKEMFAPSLGALPKNSSKRE